MNVLDILLLLAAGWFAVIGYRQGFVVGILSVVGFLGGGILAVLLLPLVWDRVAEGNSDSSVVPVLAVVIVIVFASVGQALTTQLGSQVREHITWQPARALDATGGALVNVLAMLVVAWLLGSALAVTTLPTIGREVRASRVLAGVSDVIPQQANSWFADFSSVLAQNGLPQVFQPFQNEPITDVPAPDPALTGSPVVARAKQSVVKVMGTASGCDKVLEGTGFVYAPHRVMTNAHVVGGVDEPTVQIGGEGRLLDATVVLYDWEKDIAVLDVPSLGDDHPTLDFATDDAVARDDAIVVGFPENGSFDVRAARLRGRLEASGPDIYHRGTVHRDVYSLFALVRQGNSGGPLLTPQGDVYGVIFAKSLDDDETGYALTADEVREEAEAGLRAQGPVDTQDCAL
ncbi:colicin V synthesis protein [Wenjunlia vitaminophila]|uniref:Colicin V synthesis protein n=1 Tax=Wenjunlia vitaminophila TaxID=76728 RepID=A0A0T6LN83_WENVI|nr:MarP family serine protease [Wenjunlia vitaminophila]KRV47562.1 colicin V synthesis protein [Wenjunlia vitaminophila]